MRFQLRALGFAVIEIAHTSTFSPASAVEKGEPLELRVFWSDGDCPTRAAWFCAGRLANWVDVGEA